MKLKTKKHKKLYRLSIFLLLISVATTVVFTVLTYKHAPQQKNDPTVTPTTTEGLITTDPTQSSQKQEDIKHPSPSNVNIAVSNAGQDFAGGPVVVRTILTDGINGGECIFTLSKGYATKSYSSEVIYSGTYYSCNYDIPYDGLSGGEWSLSIKVNQDNKSGETTTKITLKD